MTVESNLPLLVETLTASFFFKSSMPFKGFMVGFSDFELVSALLMVGLLGLSVTGLTEAYTSSSA